MCTVWYMTQPISHISPRRLAAIASVAAALLAPAAAHADQSAPTVEVDVADQAITIAGPSGSIPERSGSTSPATP